MFNISIGKEAIELDKEVEQKFKEALLLAIAMNIIDRAKSDIISSLSPENFIGDALDYLTEHSLPTDTVTQLEYATKMCNSFIESIDDLVDYDPDDRKLVINTMLSDFEYGTYYKPLLSILTKSVDLSLREISYV